MTNSIKRLFDDPELAVNRNPSQTAALECEQDRIYELFCTCLAPEDLKLVKKYIENNTEIQRENEYLAFRHGLRCGAEIFTDIFSGR